MKGLKITWKYSINKTHTYTHPTGDLANLWEMELSGSIPKLSQITPAGSIPFLPQEYSHLSAWVSVRRKRMKRKYVPSRRSPGGWMPLLPTGGAKKLPEESFEAVPPSGCDSACLKALHPMHLTFICRLLPGGQPPRPVLHPVKVTYLRRLKLRSSLFAKCPQSLPRCSGISLQSWPM